MPKLIKDELQFYKPFRTGTLDFPQVILAARQLDSPTVIVETFIIVIHDVNPPEFSMVTPHGRLECEGKLDTAIRRAKDDVFQTLREMRKTRDKEEQVANPSFTAENIGSPCGEFAELMELCDFKLPENIITDIKKATGSAKLRDFFNRVQFWMGQRSR